MLWPATSAVLNVFDMMSVVYNEERDLGMLRSEEKVEVEENNEQRCGHDKRQLTEGRGEASHVSVPCFRVSRCHVFASEPRKPTARYGFAGVQRLLRFPTITLVMRKSSMRVFDLEQLQGLRLGIEARNVEVTCPGGVVCAGRGSEVVLHMLT